MATPPPPPELLCEPGSPLLGTAGAAEVPTHLVLAAASTPTGAPTPASAPATDAPVPPPVLSPAAMIPTPSSPAGPAAAAKLSALAAPGGRPEVVGGICTRKVKKGESLIELARQFDLGFNAIESANPGLDPYVPPAGAPVILATSWILPRAATPGVIAVNLSEMRLFLVPRDGGAPLTYPVGIGTQGWTTPLGQFSVVEKQVNPRWYPPASIRRENPDLPAVVPAGPDNPLGTHALRLDRRSILIHGTDTPFAVGRKASHGCLRLYPEDIPQLYGRVKVGTRVAIVREPVKLGVRGGRVLLEVHDDPEAKLDYVEEARRLVTRRGVGNAVDQDKLALALRERRGFPVDVTRDGT